MKTRQEIMLLEKLKELGGRVKYCHNCRHDGRRQTSALLKIGDNYYGGHAAVSNKDVFDKKLGRVISLGRAFDSYKRGVVCKPEEQWKFKEDRVNEE